MSKYEILYLLSAGGGVVLGLVFSAVVSSFKKSIPSAKDAVDQLVAAQEQVLLAKENINEVNYALRAELDILNGVE